MIVSELVIHSQQLPSGPHWTFAFDSHAHASEDMVPCKETSEEFDVETANS
jgi:hypothetical protein